MYIYIYIYICIYTLQKNIPHNICILICMLLVYCMCPLRGRGHLFASACQCPLLPGVKGHMGLVGLHHRHTWFRCKGARGTSSSAHVGLYH